MHCCLPIHKLHQSTCCMRIIAECLNHIDALLIERGIHYVGPPIPPTPDEWKSWTTYRPMHTPPVVPKWTPPRFSGIRASDDEAGFLLNERTVCYQRGYCPSTLYDEIMELYAGGFHRSTLDMKNGLRNLTYDFIIVIRAQTEKGDEVAASCLVEFRCSVDRSTVPYLFIYELVTKPTYGRHGLAQQLVHATDVLAFLMTRCSQTNATSMWRESLEGRRLFLALTVDVTQEVGYWKSLVKLYSMCGLYARREDTPPIDYNSFSPYADPSYCIDNIPNYRLPMFKEEMPNIVYSDQITSIAVKGGGDEMGAISGWSAVFYYIIPDKSKLDLIKKIGLETPSHRCLYYHDDENIAPGKLIFQRRCPADTAVFAVMAVCSEDMFEIRSSVPSWFAVFIGMIEEMPRLMG